MNQPQPSVLSRALRKVRRSLFFYKQLRKARRLDIEFHPPNYILKNNLNSDAVVVDVGCASDPDFSRFVIEQLGLKCIGVDPTQKHAAALRRCEDEFDGRFVYLPLAIAAFSGHLTFYESETNESGSLIASHTNVEHDPTVSYKVESVTLCDLRAKLGVGTIDFIKLDLEGAEYDLIANSLPDAFANIRQLFVEFHHHALREYSTTDTANCVATIEGMGFESFTLDQHNYLFYRDS